ncbi:MAG: hypothetical protein AAF682_15840 [Planctomycetota bacterium]
MIAALLPWMLIYGVAAPLAIGAALWGATGIALWWPLRAARHAGAIALASGAATAFMLGLLAFFLRTVDAL